MIEWRWGCWPSLFHSIINSIKAKTFALLIDYWNERRERPQQPTTSTAIHHSIQTKLKKFSLFDWLIGIALLIVVEEMEWNKLWNGMEQLVEFSCPLHWRVSLFKLRGWWLWVSCPAALQFLSFHSTLSLFILYILFIL